MLRRATLKLFKLTRGPKKGKGGSKEEVKIELTTDIINIFKDRSDPEIKPISEYPPWLAQLAKPIPHPLHVGIKLYRGEKYPMEPREARRLTKWQRKMKIKTWNEEYIRPIANDTSLEHKWGVQLPGGEQSDENADDALAPFFNLSLGSDWKAEVQEEIERLKLNIGHLKDKQLG
ncbi:unnamed protein product [Blepharisma stoltei]|uniref:Mitochondrial ribosomal protein L54 n=1 Tax=Blepharisma stoltei TaxID=1481888 RepID=A0AAU9JXF8_9CILI|nr:unnamed protein product [Blepharisma stoltei]